MDLHHRGLVMSLHHRLHRRRYLLPHQQKTSCARRAPDRGWSGLRRIGVSVFVLRCLAGFGDRPAAFQPGHLHHRPDRPSHSGGVTDRSLCSSLLALIPGDLVWVAHSTGPLRRGRGYEQPSALTRLTKFGSPRTASVIRREAEKLFPSARTFVRPGFDENFRTSVDSKLRPHLSLPMWRNSPLDRKSTRLNSS